MGRLIDADALAKVLKRTSVFECIRNSADKNVFEIIDAQPTAYDVEKVVEQLMIVHDEGYCPSETLECVLDKTCSDCYREKITEIVRKGGVE